MTIRFNLTRSVTVLSTGQIDRFKNYDYNIRILDTTRLNKLLKSKTVIWNYYGLQKNVTISFLKR